MNYEGCQYYKLKKGLPKLSKEQNMANIKDDACKQTSISISE